MQNILLKNLQSFLFISMFCAVTLPEGLAQSESDETDEVAIQDAITVHGQRVEDDAMAAFRRGDYVTAEVEFLANAQCALRRERNLSASIDTARRNTARAQAYQGAQAAESGGNTQGAGAAAPPPTVGGPSVTESITTDRQAKRGRVCEERGFQLYMTGLSQLQLGKLDEALKNFKSATHLNKVLYDAHYRIGLISLMRGDKKTAKQQLRSIDTIMKRCRDCEAQDEILQRQLHLGKALDGQVKMK